MKNVVLVKSLYRNTDEYLSKEITISDFKLYHKATVIKREY